MTNTRKDLLRTKGRMWIFDEKSTVKAWKEFTLVDNVRVSHPVNATEIKSPSGATIFRTADIDAMVSCDWYHPGDLSKMELLTRGLTQLTSYNGSATQTEKVNAFFRQNNEAFPLPGFNGAKTAATVNSVKSADGTITYSVTTDYTVAVDSVTGVTHVVHVSTGSIPLNTDVVVDYTFTPLASKVLKPVYDDNLAVYRHVIIDTYPVASDLTKYRRYFLPNCTIETELGHSLLEIGKDNASPNILPITLKFANPESYSHDALWYWIDTYNA